MKSKLLLSVVGLTAMLGMNSVQAAPVIFFGEDLNAGAVAGPNSIAARTSFLGSLTGVGNQDFESFAGGTGTPINVSFPGSVGAISAGLTATSGVQVVNAPSVGRFATSGSNYLEVSSGAAFTLTFGTAIGAFGFYGTDIGDFVPTNMVMTLTDINNVSTQQIVGHTLGAANNNSLFWGFTDTTNSYTSITFSNPGGGDVFGFDDMVIGDQQQIVAIAEPGALAILGLGLIGLAYARRRRTA